LTAEKKLAFDVRDPYYPQSLREPRRTSS
jgi:hypothetical protein